MGNTVCRRIWDRVQIASRASENDDGYRGGIRCVWPDRIGEEDGDSPDAGTGEGTTTGGDTNTTSLPALEIAAAGQKYHQVHQFVYLGGLITEDADITRDISRRTKIAWGCFREFSTELFDRPNAPLRLKVRLLKAEATEALLYGCTTWPRVTLTIGSSGRRTTSSFCGSSGTTAFTAHIERYRTLKPSIKPGAKVWKRQFASDGFCSQGPWLDRVTSDSRSGCCLPRDSRGGKTRDPASRHSAGRKA